MVNLAECYCCKWLKPVYKRVTNDKYDKYICYFCYRFIKLL